MNNKISMEEFDEMTKLWRQEEIKRLAHHFHRFQDDTKQQYTRVKFFIMAEEDIDNFKAIPEIKNFDIFLSLKPDNKEAFTFFPILKILDSNGNTHLFVMHPKSDTSIDTSMVNAKDSALVPGVFKNMVTTNWEEAEEKNIDDLFVAVKNKNRLRVHYYHITDNMTNYINDHLRNNSITHITLYPGIDMNKFQYKNNISFTPVLGFRNNLPKTDVLHQMGIIEQTQDETYIEYLRPCPPTCPEA